MRIVTDHKWRYLNYYDELSPKHQKEVERNNMPMEGYIVYKGWLYHLEDFMRIENNPDLKGWHGYHSDSFFSGIVIRLSDDGEQYQIGTYYS